LDYMIDHKMMDTRVKDLFKLVKTPEEAVTAIQDPTVPWTPGQAKQLVLA
jgi:hypothetical protein